MPIDLLAQQECERNQSLAGRWFIGSDMNCDGQFSISDVREWFVWAFYLPGDGVIWLLLQKPDVARFLELTTDSYGAWGSGLFSFFVWAFVGLVFIVAVAAEW